PVVSVSVRRLACVELIGKLPLRLARLLRHFGWRCCQNWPCGSHAPRTKDVKLRTGKGTIMPEKETIERAREDKREGKSPTTQAGEFVREEMHHIREGKHGARSPQQAIAIGLSKARRAGVELPPPEEGTTSEKTRRSA